MRAAAFLATLVLVAACSSGDDDGAAGASSPSPSPVTTSAPTTTAAPTAATVDDLLALDRPIVLAHTGGEDEFPGSTLYAFGESARAGVDVLDLNVQLTKDGVLVVHHDADVDGATNGTGLVADLTYDELHRLDDAHWFTEACTCPDQPADAYVWRGVRTGEVEPPAGYEPDDFAIPRFRDVVAAHPDLPLNIEVKGEGEPAIAAARVLVDELHELGRADAAVVTSFDDDVVAALQAFDPDLEASPGQDASTAWVLGRTPLPGGMRILQLPPTYQGLAVITPELIADSHASGYVIWVWPNDRALENEASYRSFVEQGLDGLNINFPAQGVAAVSGS